MPEIIKKIVIRPSAGENVPANKIPAALKAFCTELEGKTPVVGIQSDDVAVDRMQLLNALGVKAQQANGDVEIDWTVDTIKFHEVDPDDPSIWTKPPVPPQPDELRAVMVPATVGGQKRFVCIAFA